MQARASVASGDSAKLQRQCATMHADDLQLASWHCESFDAARQMESMASNGSVRGYQSAVSAGSLATAGSLLRIRNAQTPLFTYREFEGATSSNGTIPIYLVLDGQQRLTSLYQAFHGLGHSRFVVNVRRLIEGRDFDECIFHHMDVERKAKHYEDVQTQAKELVMPLKMLGHDIGGAFAQWLDVINFRHRDCQLLAVSVTCRRPEINLVS